MTRRRWILVLLALSSPAPLGCGMEDAAPSPQPNVVLIVMDTTAASHLSLYGHARRTSPRLEEIAAEGVAFENAYGVSAWTMPNHASLFTGLFPSEHWTTYEHPILEPVHPTLAEILRHSGYRTFGVSNNAWVYVGRTFGTRDDFR